MILGAVIPRHVLDAALTGGSETPGKIIVELHGEKEYGRKTIPLNICGSYHRVTNAAERLSTCLPDTP